jgi:hypothetical protein
MSFFIGTGANLEPRHRHVEHPLHRRTGRDLLLHAVETNQTGRTGRIGGRVVDLQVAKQYDHKPYDDKLKRLGLHDEDVLERARPLQKARNELIHEKAYLGPIESRVAQREAESAHALLVALRHIGSPADVWSAPMRRSCMAAPNRAAQHRR